jgi:hypothetical protein
MARSWNGIKNVVRRKRGENKLRSVEVKENIERPQPEKTVCPICERNHPPEFPHDVTSMYYVFAFKVLHNRVPTWDDASAHCSEEIRQKWKDALLKLGYEWVGVPEGETPIANLGGDEK